MKLRTANDELGWQQVNAIDFAAVCSDGVNLPGRVLRTLGTARRDAVAPKPNHNDVARNARPLALNPKELSGDFEHKVVAPVLRHGLEHGDPELGGRRSDLEFCHGALQVRVMRLHERMFPAEADGSQPTERAGASPQSCSRR